MIVAYDRFDYPFYWQGRVYENLSEKKALQRLLKLIPKRKKAIDIGSGYGRLTDTYLPYFKKVVLVDPSQKLLNLAKNKFCHHQNISFRKGRIEKLPFNKGSFEVVFLIRVSHHLVKIEKSILEVNRILAPHGYLILEFANKVHLKAIIRSILKGNWQFLTSHLPVNLSSDKKTPFFNYHPNHIKSILMANDYQIIKVLSVSNFRHSLIKKMVPLRLLILLESIFSLVTSHFSLVNYFGPSIFILARKKSV